MSNFLLRNSMVFIHIPKTGGTTIRRSLCPAVDGPVFGYIPNEWLLRHKITIIRHPLQRLVSAYYDFKYNRGSNLTIRKFLDIVLNDSLPYTIKNPIRHHTIPQTHPYNCLFYANRILRYENYADEVRLTFGVDVIPKLRTSRKEHWRKVIPTDYVDKMINYYKYDFQLGYGVDHVD